MNTRPSIQTEETWELYSKTQEILPQMQPFSLHSLKGNATNVASMDTWPGIAPPRIKEGAMVEEEAMAETSTEEEEVAEAMAGTMVEKPGSVTFARNQDT